MKHNLIRGLGRGLVQGCLALVWLVSVPATAGETVAVAAAANLQLVMREIAAQFRQVEPQTEVQLSFGSSGKLNTQIQQGAPFDLFLSADLAFAQELVDKGFTLGPVTPYGAGRLVLWSATVDARALQLKDLADERFARVAIANPRHAPYGMRAEEALRAEGVWEAVEKKLVFGENIAQTAQFARTGNAQVGLISLSLALDPELSSLGGYAVVPDRLHAPLLQGRVKLRRAENRPEVDRFIRFLDGPEAAALLERFGYATTPAAAPASATAP